MKAVLDTNIWVSAVIWGGVPDQILLLKQRQLLTIAISQQLLNEIEATFNKKKLQAKLKNLNLTVSTLINLIRESVVLYPIEEISVSELRDPDDNIVLATAIAAGADAIVTGDRDLLVLGEYQGIQIVTAQDFLHQYFNPD